MIQMYLRSIHCHEETDEVGADEPYVLVTAVNLASTVQVSGFPVPLPAFDVVSYRFNDVDDEETHDAPGIPGTSGSFWGVGGAPAPLTDPDRAIFVVALIENDDGDPEALRGIVKGVVGSSVLGSLTAGRPTKVAALLQDINSAMGTPTGAPNFDDKVGLSELRFSVDELRRAEAGEPVRRSLHINGDGGRYELTFEARLRGWQHGVPGGQVPGIKPDTSPAGWYTFPENVQHIAYVGTDNQIHELFYFIGGDGTWHHGTPSAGHAPVKPGTSPTAWYSHPENVQHIAYVGTDNQIHELFYFIH